MFGRPTGLSDAYLELPCGHCIGCYMDRALHWKTRIVHEAMSWPVSNLFVTLQYRDDALPSSFGLEYEDFQNFMKRLRLEVEGVTGLPDGRRPIRFFVVGEYGGKTYRPHWHAVLFNTAFQDCRWWTRKGLRVGHSLQLEKLWSHGHVELGPLNAASAAYCAGYVHKKALHRCVDAVNLETGEIFERRAEFQNMSRRPGLGSYWYARFGADLFPLDGAVVAGKRHKVPRYYWNKYQEEASASDVEAIRQARVARAALLPEEESSLERRAVREEAAELRQVAFGGRGL